MSKRYNEFETIAKLEEVNTSLQAQGITRVLWGTEDSSSPFEPDDDMPLVHYQKDINLEALARRASTKNKSRSKKGRSTSTNLLETGSWRPSLLRDFRGESSLSGLAV
ncbi:uncharacterized protein LOC120268734 [Dioscorea cayenensis subsp. rotundata]|uniref:Uncharacterized protein LOC120268734 n=1 Tax=Dioscorea cayennensis subsp. rotundata TaxID=55577 RepID=A0AB40BWX3_DIOCR|nr:uncharacterized protein LOC120268734 [Dioscorea cayenensis subsp. rotundata]